METPETPTAQRILQSALDLFSAKGYEATSVREICEASGITKPTLYHFYGNKEGVYRALVDGGLDRHRSDLAELVARPEPAPSRLRAFARHYFADAREHERLMRFIFGLIHNPSTATPPTDFAGFYAEIVRLTSGVIDEGVTAGKFVPGPTRIRTIAFLGALGEAVVGSLLCGCGQPELTAELADALVDTVIQGWLPRT